MPRSPCGSATGIACAGSTPVGVAVVAAGLGGAWVGSHQSVDADRVGSDAARRRLARRAAGGRAPAVAVRQPGAAPRRRLARRPHVLAGAPRRGGGARRREDGPRALGQSAHERRQVASTTKIMTALLALRKLRPHDIVTVDKSVPRVPLVREGLRARASGRGVEALLLAAPLLRQRRRTRARDRRRRRQMDVHPRDERRGEDARPARHALLVAERRQGRTTTRAPGTSPR